MADPAPARRIVLASASRSRADLLRNAGLTVEIEPANIDEDEIKAGFRAEQASVQLVAETLADFKAERVSRRHPDAFVIAADQILDCEGVWFDKPPDLAAAAGHLRALRGRTHELVTSVSVFRDSRRLWHTTDRARLTMRPFSDAFVESYLDRVGARACESVGAYQLEGLGAQLFSRLDGDYFTILGLPLLPLLGFLREHELVDT